MSKSRSKKSKKYNSLFRLILGGIGIIILFAVVIFLGNWLTTTHYKSPKVPLSFNVPKYFPLSSPSNEKWGRVYPEAVSFDSSYAQNENGSLYGGITVNTPPVGVSSLSDYIDSKKKAYLESCVAQKVAECKVPEWRIVPFGKYNAATLLPSGSQSLAPEDIAYYTLIENGLLYNISFVLRDPKTLTTQLEESREQGVGVQALILSIDQQTRAFSMIKNTLNLSR